MTATAQAGAAVEAVPSSRIVREVLPSPSPHVQLALVQVPGPSHLIEAQPYLRITLNVGPRYVIDADGPQGRQRFDCQRHSLLVIPPDTSVHHYAGLPKPAGRPYVPVRLATFRLSRELLAETAMALGLRARQAQLEHQVLATDEVLRGMAQALLSDLRAGGPDGAAALERLASGFVARVLVRQQRSGPTATSDALARVQAHIDEHLQADLPLEALAQLAGMSTFHFCRVFRERLGATPHQFILSRRLARAKRLLWQQGEGRPPLSMVDVALLCGFSSSSHFAAQFKRHTGQTPLQWQRQGPSAP